MGERTTAGHADAFNLTYITGARTESDLLAGGLLLGLDVLGMGEGAHGDVKTRTKWATTTSSLDVTYLLLGLDLGERAVVHLGEGHVASLARAAAVLVDLALGACLLARGRRGHLLEEGHVAAGNHARGGEGRGGDEGGEEDERAEHCLPEWERCNMCEEDVEVECCSAGRHGRRAQLGGRRSTENATGSGPCPLHTGKSRIHRGGHAPWSWLLYVNAASSAIFFLVRAASSAIGNLPSRDLVHPPRFFFPTITAEWMFRFPSGGAATACVIMRCEE